MIIFCTKQIYLFSNQKLFGCYTSIIIYIFKTMRLFCGQRIFGVPPLASQAFLHFHGLPPLKICITTCTWSFTPGGVYLCLLLPDTYFHFHVSNHATQLDFIQRDRVVHKSITKHGVDSYHALTPLSCDVLVHNAMRCVTTCLYYVTYMMNSIWTI